MLRVIFIISFVTSFSIYGVTQIIQPFSVRFSASQKGGIKILSNIAITCNSTNSNCSIYQNQIPPNGNHNQDGGITMGYVDVDMDASTWMSSSDSLNLPIFSEISWAGLYWSSRINSNITNYTNRNQVRIKVDNGAYVNLTADNLLDLTSIPGNPGFNMPSYYCFKDITSIVQPVNGNARFTIANVVSQTGSSNLFGTWTIVIVYKNSFQSMRNLTVFDGMAYVSNQNNLDIPVSGFTSPTVGPVSFEFGIVAYEGDRNIQGDRLQFNGNGTFLDVPDPLRNSNDFFNSSITSNGSLTPYRDPSYNNTLGLDVGMFNPNNSNQAYLPNNATSATIRVMTTQDAILPRVITSSIDILETFDISATNSTICAGQPTTLSVQSIDGLVSTLNCDSATNTGTLTEAVAASSVSSSVPYSGGNGGVYDGQIIASTGVSGLTATITAGVFNIGWGNLTYSITGTPSASGTANFALNIGGQTCALNLPVASNQSSQYPTGSVFCASGPTEVVDVVNPLTGRTWMDRNLGASQVAISSTDTAAYGDLYQWGRGADGHQCRNSATTTTLSSTDQPGHGYFIISNNDPNFNWRDPQNTNLWQGLIGINNPCPFGYRIPTDSEFETEKSTWISQNSSGGYQSILKLTLAGLRLGYNGDFDNLNNGGFYWVSNVVNESSNRLNLYYNFAYIDPYYRRNALSLRCIKD